MLSVDARDRHEPEAKSCAMSSRCAEIGRSPPTLSGFLPTKRARGTLQQSVNAEKNRGDALSKRFEEALKQANQEPITRPTRDFDLD